MEDLYIYVAAPDPENGDVVFRMDYPFQRGGFVPEPTDAELINIGQALLNSDYIQNQSWGGTAELKLVQVPAIRTIYPTP